MILTIMQPAYLPWLGYFDRILKSDAIIVLDHVQMDMSSKTRFANRNKIRTRDGWIWLTVPMKTKGKYGDLYLNEIEVVDDADWARKHRLSLDSNYRKASFYKDHEGFLDIFYGQKRAFLSDICNKMTGYILRKLQIEGQIFYSSQMKSRTTKSQLILDLCQEVGATEYISGPFGRDYLDREAFKQAGIKVWFHDYAHPVYTQAFEGFEPYMSALDLIMNHGPDSRNILESPKESLRSE